MLKRKSKRVLSIVLAVAMIVGLFPIAAFAEGVDGTTARDSSTSSTTAAWDGTITNTIYVDPNKGDNNKDGKPL